jgi:hypothetical protein
MNNKEDLLNIIEPILKYLKSNPIDSTLEEALNQEFSIDTLYMQQIKELCMIGVRDGWLCPRSGTDLQYGRLAKASSDTYDFGIDTVDMTNAGPGHTHPNGEIDLCFCIEGRPSFDGNPEGWTVYQKNTWHIPTVTGGRMVIIYFLPSGAISFGPKPD